VPLRLLRWPEPENVEEAAAGLACLDDDGRVHQRREILRAIETPDVAILHLEEETALGSTQLSTEAQGCGRPGHGTGYRPIGAAHAESGFMTALLLQASFPL